MNYDEIQSLTDAVNSSEKDKALLTDALNRAEKDNAILQQILADTNIQLEKTRAGVVPSSSPAPAFQQPMSFTPRGPPRNAIVNNSHGAIPSTPRTPYTPGGRFAITNGNTPHTRGATRRSRHRRALTPTTPFALGATAAAAPQDDLGLLRDFFDDIKEWSKEWVICGQISAEDVSTILAPGSTISNFLDDVASSSGPKILQDEALRTQLVTGLVSCYIVLYAMSENFLDHSQWPGAELVKNILPEFEQFHVIGSERRLELLQQQSELYTHIKSLPNHNDVRAAASLKHSEIVVIAVCCSFHARVSSSPC